MARAGADSVVHVLPAQLLRRLPRTLRAHLDDATAELPAARCHPRPRRHPTLVHRRPARPPPRQRRVRVGLRRALGDAPRPGRAPRSSTLGASVIPRSGGAVIHRPDPRTHHYRATKLEARSSSRHPSPRANADHGDHPRAGLGRPGLRPPSRARRHLRVVQHAAEQTCAVPPHNARPQSVVEPDQQAGLRAG
jgi:hypothetical protein